MPTINTVIRPELSQLAYENTDMMMNLVYNEGFPAMAVNVEKGQFRAGESNTWFLEPDAQMSKFTTARLGNYSDSPQNFNLFPEGLGFEFSNADLQQPQIYGYATRQEMINSRVMWRSTQLKKKKEKALYTFVSDNGNFASSSYYANAGTAWSDTTNATPVADVMTGLVQCPEANAMIINKYTFRLLQQNASLAAMTTVYGPARDGGVNPSITVDFLKNVFQVEYLWVASGKFITDSSDPTDTTKADIWGARALLFYHNPNLNDKDGRWLKHLFWNVDGASSDEGWLVTETYDPEVGLVGLYRWQVGSYYQFLSQRTELAYRIDALYS